jgi:hypothetical protein
MMAVATLLFTHQAGAATAFTGLGVTAEVAALFPGSFFENTTLGQDSNATLTSTDGCPGMSSSCVVDLNGQGSFTNDSVLDVSQGRALHSFTVPIQGFGDGTTLRITGLELHHFSASGVRVAGLLSPVTVVRSGNGNTITSKINLFEVIYDTTAKTVKVRIKMDNLAGDSGMVTITWEGSFSGSTLSQNLPQSIILTPDQQRTALRSISTEFSNHFDVLRGFVNGTGKNNAVRHVADAMSFHKTGLSAGDGDYRWGAWGSFTYTDSENDSVLARSESSRTSFIGGADWTPWSDNVIFGVAVGFEHIDTETAFNGGEQQVDGITIAPYIAAFWGENFSADLTAGYTSLNADQFRTQAGAVVSSEVDSDRMFASANANYTRAIGAWRFGARAGLLYARDKADAFTESDGTSRQAATFKLGMLTVSAEAAYSAGAWEPFGSLAYENDFSKTDVQVGGISVSPDDAGVVAGIGVRYYGTDNVTSVIQVNSVFGRDNIDEHTFNATIRADF